MGAVPYLKESCLHICRFLNHTWITGALVHAFEKPAALCPEYFLGIFIPKTIIELSSFTFWLYSRRWYKESRYIPRFVSKRVGWIELVTTHEGFHLLQSILHRIEFRVEIRCLLDRSCNSERHRLKMSLKMSPLVQRADINIPQGLTS